MCSLKYSPGEIVGKVTEGINGRQRANVGKGIIGLMKLWGVYVTV